LKSILTTKGSGTERLFFVGSGNNFGSLGGGGANGHGFTRIFKVRIIDAKKLPLNFRNLSVY
jgi:hypothetical protein